MTVTNTKAIRQAAPSALEDKELNMKHEVTAEQPALFSVANFFTEVENTRERHLCAALSSTCIHTGAETPTHNHIPHTCTHTPHNSKQKTKMENKV